MKKIKILYIEDEWSDIESLIKIFRETRKDIDIHPSTEVKNTEFIKNIKALFGEKHYEDVLYNRDSNLKFINDIIKDADGFIIDYSLAGLVKNNVKGINFYNTFISDVDNLKNRNVLFFTAHKNGTEEYIEMEDLVNKIGSVKKIKIRLLNKKYIKSDSLKIVFLDLINNVLFIESKLDKSEGHY